MPVRRTADSAETAGRARAMASAEALRRGAAAVEKGGRYFIDARIDPELQREGH